MVARESLAARLPSDAIPRQHAGRHIGTTEIRQAKIDHNHIYLRSFFREVPG